MKGLIFASVLAVAAGHGLCRGQVSGNIAYGPGAGKTRAQQREQALRAGRAAPVILEPVVQCTLYLKVKYEIEQPKAK